MAVFVGVTLASLAASWGVWILADRGYRHTRWDHWDVVKPGILYRSGQLSPDELEQAVARFGIRTVVNLRLPTENGTEEKAVARSLGVDYRNYPMPGDGFGLESQFREFLELFDQPERQPVLVHCARGTCRTGAAVAMYRFERDGWTIEDVQREFDRQVYRNGFLAGYVFEMVPPERRANWVLMKSAMEAEPPAIAARPQGKMP
jgi:protein tyrosine phosphatase (PTP) superfamily phosphohydrolase (DUF442 family)